MSESILTEIHDGAATITLNRPRAINALGLEMFQRMFDTLHSWARDDEVRSVHFEGAGERGFSAGADVRELSGMVSAGQNWLSFLELEYALDGLIASYPKPTSAALRGITMGGGLGIAAKTDRRTVDGTSLLAMPETKIGLFPDAGVMYQLARGGAVGTHIALTSATFTGGDALRLGLADETAGSPHGPTLPSPLFDAADDWIEECYQGDDVVQMAQRLESHPHPDAQQAARDLRARSPYAVTVSLRALRRAAGLDQAEVLAQDLRIVERVIPVDFVEGVRALLVDKDNRPSWRHERLEDVPDSVVDDAFAW